MHGLHMHMNEKILIMHTRIHTLRTCGLLNFGRKAINAVVLHRIAHMYITKHLQIGQHA